MLIITHQSNPMYVLRLAFHQPPLALRSLISNLGSRGRNGRQALQRVPILPQYQNPFPYLLLFLFPPSALKRPLKKNKELSFKKKTCRPLLSGSPINEKRRRLPSKLINLLTALRPTQKKLREAFTHLCRVFPYLPPLGDGAFLLYER